MKYKNNHKKCLPCPPKNAIKPTKSFSAFRLILGEELTPDDFLPQAKTQPSRSFKNASEHCSMYALSYFDTKSNIRKFHKKLIKSNKNLVKLWSSIAESNISKTDAMITPKSKNGHFDLHESATSNLIGQSVLVGKL